MVCAPQLAGTGTGAGAGVPGCMGIGAGVMNCRSQARMAFMCSCRRARSAAPSRPDRRRAVLLHEVEHALAAGGGAQDGVVGRGGVGWGGGRRGWRRCRGAHAEQLGEHLAGIARRGNAPGGRVQEMYAQPGGVIQAVGGADSASEGKRVALPKRSASN
jgi:hypothetical protein